MQKIDARPIHILFPYYVMWYLPATLFWTLTIKFIDTENKKKQLLILVISAAGVLLAGSELGKSFLSISRTLSFYPYFVMGYYYKKNGMKEYLENRKEIICYSIAEVVLIFIGILLWGNKIHVSVFHHISVFENYQDVFMRYSFLLAAFPFLILFLFAVPDKEMRIFTKLGKNTLPVYLTHVLIIQGLKRVIQKSEIPMSGCIDIVISVSEAIIISILFALINDVLDKRKIKRQNKEMINERELQ